MATLISLLSLSDLGGGLMRYSDMCSGNVVDRVTILEQNLTILTNRVNTLEENIAMLASEVDDLKCSSSRTESRINTLGIVTLTAVISLVCVLLRCW